MYDGSTLTSTVVSTACGCSGTVTFSTAADALSIPSPGYDAWITCAPEPKPETVNVACPLASSTPPLTGKKGTPLSSNETSPVGTGAPPPAATVAVKVTGSPGTTTVGSEVSVIVVGCVATWPTFSTSGGVVVVMNDLFL